MANQQTTRPADPLDARRRRRMLVGQIGATAGMLVIVGAASAALIHGGGGRAVKAVEPDVADRATCTSVQTAAAAILSGVKPALAPISVDVTILDPRVQETPEWKSAALEAADIYGQAAAAIVIAPGTTEILADAADAYRAALRMHSVAYRTFDSTIGNATAVQQEARSAVEILCERQAHG